MRGNEALTEIQGVMKMVRYWHRLPILVVGSPSLEIFTSQLDASEGQRVVPYLRRCGKRALIVTEPKF